MPIGHDFRCALGFQVAIYKMRVLVADLCRACASLTRSVESGEMLSVADEPEAPAARAAARPHWQAGPGAPNSTVEVVSGSCSGATRQPAAGPGNAGYYC